jgi:hypothetical protein
MSAIDLLFAAKQDSERLHQLVLGPVLAHTRLIPALLKNPDLKPCDFDWEPEARQFDLAITLEDERVVWVELKVDAGLSDEQIKRQLQTLAAHPDHRLLYLLLGYSAIVVDRQRLHRAREGLGLTPERVNVVTAAELLPLLGDPTILPGVSQRHHGDARDLVGAYRDLLTNLRHRTTRFFEHTGAWSAGDYLGFFDHCRRSSVGHMADAGTDHVANPSGGFMGCWWNWAPVQEGAKLYLQLEDQRLCFKVFVPAGLSKRRGEVRGAAERAVRAAAARRGLAVARPARFGHGAWMTVAFVDDIGVGQQDQWDRFCKTIVAAETVVNAAAGEMRAAHPRP